MDLVTKQESDGERKHGSSRCKMDFQTALHIMKSIPLFKDWNIEKIERLTKKLESVQFLAGEDLMVQGEIGEEFFIIIDGKCEVIINGVPLDGVECKEGDYVGEIALQNADSKRTATVRAKNYVTCLECSAETFKSVIQGYVTFEKRETKPRKRKIDDGKKRGSSRRKMEFSVALDIMKSIPLFQEWSAQKLETLTRKLESVQFDAGEDLMVQGEIGEEFFIIIDGKCEVIINGVPLDGVECKEGDYVGEIALLKEDSKRTATVRAKNYVTCLGCSAETFKTVIQGFVKFDKREDPRTKKRVVGKKRGSSRRKMDFQAALVLMKSIPLFKGWSSPKIERLTRKLESVQFASGEDLMVQGEIGEEFFIIIHGKCEVLVNGAALEGVECKEGDYVGELALLNQDSKRTATVRAKTHVTCLGCNADTFKTVIQGSVVFEKRAGKPKQLQVNNTKRKIDGVKKRGRSRHIMDFQAALDIMKTIALFKDWPAQKIEELTKKLESVHFAAGEDLMCQGEIGEEFFIIIDGKCAVIVDGVPLHGIECKEGDYVGEIALMARDSRRTATVRAKNFVTCLGCNVETFKSVIQGSVTWEKRENQPKRASITQKQATKAPSDGLANGDVYLVVEQRAETKDNHDEMQSESYIAPYKRRIDRTQPPYKQNVIKHEHIESASGHDRIKLPKQQPTSIEIGLTTSASGNAGSQKNMIDLQLKSDTPPVESYAIANVPVKRHGLEETILKRASWKTSAIRVCTILLNLGVVFTDWVLIIGWLKNGTILHLAFAIILFAHFILVSLFGVRFTHPDKFYKTHGTWTPSKLHSKWKGHIYALHVLNLESSYYALVGLFSCVEKTMVEAWATLHNLLYTSIFKLILQGVSFATLDELDEELSLQIMAIGASNIIFSMLAYNRFAFKTMELRDSALLTDLFTFYVTHESLVKLPFVAIPALFFACDLYIRFGSLIIFINRFSTAPEIYLPIIFLLWMLQLMQVIFFTKYFSYNQNPAPFSRLFGLPMLFVSINSNCSCAGFAMIAFNRTNFSNYLQLEIAVKYGISFILVTCASVNSDSADALVRRLNITFYACMGISISCIMAIWRIFGVGTLYEDNIEKVIEMLMYFDGQGTICGLPCQFDTADRMEYLTPELQDAIIQTLQQYEQGMIEKDDVKGRIKALQIELELDHLMTAQKEIGANEEDWHPPFWSEMPQRISEFIEERVQQNFGAHTECT